MHNYRCWNKWHHEWNQFPKLVQKIVKKVKQTSLNTKAAFSSLITRKDKKYLKMKVQDVNNRLKNYCSQTNIEYIKNNNIKEEHLGKKWLHLNKRENIIFANILLKFLRSNFWDGEFLNSFVVSEEYKSEKLDISSDDPCFSSFKICATEKYSSNIFAHLNINSLRNKSDGLVDQIKGNVDILVISEILHYLFDGIEMNSWLELWFL